MNILIAVPSFFPSQDGVANITGYLAEGLVQKGHNVSVLTSAGNGGLQQLPYYEEYNGVSITRMRVYTRWPLTLRGRDKESTQKFYFDFVQKRNPDVLIVVCAQTWTLDWIRPYLDKLDCVKVFYSHGYSWLKDNYEYAKYLKKRNILGALIEWKCKKYYQNLYRTLGKFDRAVYLAEDNNSAVYAKVHDLHNGAVLKNAIDDRFFALKKIRDQQADEGDEVKFLFVANFSENKDQNMLIRAFAKADIGKSSLILVAFEENAYSETMKETIRTHLQNQNDKQVVLKVHIEREEVIDLYRTCDVFACSSRSETYSIVAHEAAAAGMPIISTDVGIYGSITGARIVADEADMSKAMEELGRSAAERRKCGDMVHEWVMNQPCKIQDKVDWLENDLKALCGENAK